MRKINKEGKKEKFKSTQQNRPIRKNKNRINNHKTKRSKIKKQRRERKN